MTQDPKVGDTWYRYSDYIESRGYWDIHDEYVRTGSDVKVCLEEWCVIRITPFGVVLEGNRLVCHHWTKKFAHPTILEAAESFVIRKERQASIYRNRMQNAAFACRLGLALLEQAKKDQP